MSEVMERVVKPGDNNPPEPTPFELSATEIDDLTTEAKNWLDGGKVASQAEADAIAKLLDLARKTKKKADEARKTENEPFDKGKAEVQARYNPLLARADLIADACKKANAPWLKRLADEQEAEAKRLRDLADEEMRKAQEALRASAPTDLAARQEATQTLDSAEIAHRVALKAEKAKPQAKGGARAMSLRTVYTPVLTDAREAARHYWIVARPEMEAFFLDLAKKDIAIGNRTIPGFEITEDKVAV